jgi:hypothetical protein
MRVAVLSFGTNWWARSPRAATRFAGYNSTGIECGSKVRRHWVVPGIVRFNGLSDFVRWPSRQASRRCFLCSDLSSYHDGNRLLLIREIDDEVQPEAYLLTVASATHGRVDLNSQAWCAPSSRVVAASQLRERQEIMLLMRADDWLLTGRGLWQLRLTRGRCADLILLADEFQHGARQP